MSLKDIDTFIQHFIQKCVQVIIQSRLGTERTQTKCNPNGKDWFNLNINDLKDIVDQTSNCFKSVFGSSPSQNLNFVRKDWKICCEISLQNFDGISLVLEYWIFSNISLNSTQDSQVSQLVYKVLNRMSSIIKSLIVLTRSTPAHKLSSKGQSGDSYVICYRVYKCDENFVTDFMNSGDQANHFSQIKTLGTIKSSFNELSIQLIYRTNMNICFEPESKAHKIEETIICSKENLLLPVKYDHFKKENLEPKFDMNEIFKPINPAFATKNSKDCETNCMDMPFSALLTLDNNSTNSNSDNDSAPSTAIKSNPISIPESVSLKQASKSPQVYSTSSESFVFVELNAPFASDDREFGSFFNGPSPTFMNNSDESNNDINELSVQLAELESNAPLIDSFVESICLTESQELKFET